MPSEFLSGRFTVGLYTKINILKTIANYKEDYIDKAIKYANDNEFTKKCNYYLKLHKKTLFLDHNSITEYNKIFELLYNQII